MHNGKRILSVFLVILMVFSLYVSAFAEQAAEKDGSKTAVKKITISGSKFVAKGKKVTLKATVKPAGASQKVTWKSSNKKIATVSSKGVVKGKKAGTVTITATSKANPKIKKSWKMTVTAKPVKKIKIKASTTELDLNKTASVKLKATVSPKQAASDVTWSSSDPSVATVTSKGKVTALKKGTAEITATAVDGSGVKASVTIKVVDSSSSEPSDLPDHLDVNITDNGDKNYTFSIDFPGLKETYHVNEPETPINTSDFHIGFQFHDANATYEISTVHFKTEENPTDLTLYQMQTTLWKQDGNSYNSIGYPTLNIQGTTIYWTVTLPEDFDASTGMIEFAFYQVEGHYHSNAIDKPLK